MAPSGAVPWRLAVSSALRVSGSVVALLALYFLLPMRRVDDASPVTLLVIALVALTTLIAIQVRGIMGSPSPRLRAVESLASSLPLLVLSFATAYFLMAEANEATFTQPLTRTDALYFAVTVFATVGFGDIAPVSQTARSLVTLQMVANLVAVGVGVRVIIGAVEVGRSRQATSSDSASP